MTTCLGKKFYVQTSGDRLDSTKLIGGKAIQLRNIIKHMIPDWVAITADCPDEILSEVVEYCSHLIQTPSYSSYAVRSSALAEDGEEQSYAGIFESKLNVPITGLEHAVREVRGSANTARSEAYLNKMGVSHHYHNFEDKYRNDVAVIIMPMIDAKYSGVLFTKEPLGGTNKGFLEYEEGAGGVVDGTGDSTYLFLDPEDFWNSEWEILPKDMELPVQKIWEEAQRLENNYRKPLDIEWAIGKNGKPWVLQVRPVTA